MNFIFHRSTEFIYALDCIKYGPESVKKSYKEEHGLDLDEGIAKYIAEMNNKLSSFQKREIEYFTGMPYRYMFANLAFKNPSINSVEEFLKLIENTDTAYLLSLPFLYILRDLDSISYEQLDVKELENDIKKLYEVTYKWKVKDDYDQMEKDRLLELLTFPEESKMRMVTLYKSIYEYIYKDIETEVEKIIDPIIKQYKNEYTKSKSEFIKKYNFQTNLFSSVNNKNNYIHISYFYYLMYDIFTMKDGHWACLGIDRHKTDRLLKTKVFLKAISEDTRFEIVQLLLERPYYAREISEKLDLSPSSISHHIGSLTHVGIVKTKSEGQRSYYYLDIEALEELFDNAKRDILSK